MKQFKYFLIILLFGSLLTACNDYLDVNVNPNYPQEDQVPPHAILPALIQQLSDGIAFDSRFIGRYTQNWVDVGAAQVWDRHGYNTGSDNGGQIWRSHYWTLGKNIQVMLDTALKAGRPIYAGMAYALRAWSWQTLTDYHGEVILRQAFDDSKLSFDFDSQEDVYKHVVATCDTALSYFNQASKADPQLAAADQFFGGNAARWRKFVWGIRARNLIHLTNKTSFNADAVIAACDSSMTANADNATVPYDGNLTANSNFYGTNRSNLTGFRISGFIARIMNGQHPTTFGARDPRTKTMIPIATGDSIARGAEPGVGAAGTVLNPWGTTTVNPASTGNRGRYIFVDNARFPIMTVSEILFIRAEAQFRKGNKALALADFKKAIDLHADFINTYATQQPATTPLLTATEKTALLANPTIVPTVTDSLSMARIMIQKYVALWGWGHVETWNDLRRYHYGTDSYDGKVVFETFTIPIILFNDNQGKPAYRVRPRYNSEYVWNRNALDKIGGLSADYHTKETWMSKP